MSCCTVSPEYLAMSRYAELSRSTVTCKRSNGPSARAPVQSESTTLPPAAGPPAVEGGDGWSTELDGAAALLVGAVGTTLVGVVGLAVASVSTTVDAAMPTPPELGGMMVEVLGGSVIDEVGRTIDDPLEAVVADDVLPPLHAAAERPSSAMSGTAVLANIVPSMEECS